MSRVMRTSVGTVTQVSMKFVEKEERKQKGGYEYRTEHKTRSATQVERQAEMKAYTHDTDSQKQANRQGLCVRETEAIIGKAPWLGTHTWDGKIHLQGSLTRR